jgi:hypothetical protein
LIPINYLFTVFTPQCFTVDDNIVYIKLVPDINDIISPDIIDVALSYSIAGIKVVFLFYFYQLNNS